MAIDIRATTECSLGPLISASISDDYIQGNGLVKTQGSCLINGIITPPIGTLVDFHYTKQGVTRRLPRALRVLSVFADPFRGTTEVQLGCKLTYLQDKREAVRWTPLSGPPSLVTLPGAFGGTTYADEDQDTIVIPMVARDVMNKCLTELGITASSNPLTNVFTVEEFNFDSGYVQILNDLLISESYCGYLDRNEVLQVFPLNQVGGTGPVLDGNSIIDISSIGVGELPGEAVTVNYSTVKLKPNVRESDANEYEDQDRDQDRERGGWDSTVTTNLFTIPIAYETGLGSGRVFRTKIYNVSETTSTTTTYKVIGVGDQQKRVVSRRTTELKTQAIAIAGGLAAEYLKEGIPFPNDSVSKRTEEVYRYNADGEQIYYERQVSGSAWYVIGSLGLRFVFSPTDYVQVFFGGSAPIEAEIQSGLVSGRFKNVITSTLGSWFQTIQGQQAIAASQESFSNSAEVSGFINAGYTGTLMLLDRRVTIERVSGSTEAPSRQAVALGRNTRQNGSSQGGVRTSDFRRESSSEITLALGSATAQLVIEYSMPYAPDDIFTGPSLGPYQSVPSNAEQKAKLFGLTQNRLRLGNRSGMGVQVSPETLPTAPFAPYFVSANDQLVLYRTNGLNWSISNEGVILSSDGLFWGGAGGSGTPWFPVGPGATALVAPPSIFDTSPTSIIGTVPTVGSNPGATLGAAFPSAVAGNGVQDLSTDEFWVYSGTAWASAGTVPGQTANIDAPVPVWNESTKVLGSTSTGIKVKSLPYALNRTTSLSIGTRTGVSVVSSQAVKEVPDTQIELTVLAPSVYSPVTPPLQETSLEVLAPTIKASAVVKVPLVTYEYSVISSEIDVAAITYSQTTVYAGNDAATNSGMTNGVFEEATQSATSYLAIGGEWIRMDLGDVFPVRNIIIGCDFLGTLAGGWDKTYTEGRYIEYSLTGDSLDWTEAFVVPTLTAGITSFPVSFFARYIRIRGDYGNYVAVTEFYATSA